MERKCENCGKRKDHHARGLCYGCYRAWYERERYRSMTPKQRTVRLKQMREAARARRKKLREST